MSHRPIKLSSVICPSVQSRDIIVPCECGPLHEKVSLTAEDEAEQCLHSADRMLQSVLPKRRMFTAKYPCSRRTTIYLLTIINSAIYLIVQYRGETNPFLVAEREALFGRKTTAAGEQNYRSFRPRTYSWQAPTTVRKLKINPNCDPNMNIVIVACGERLEQTMNLIQSILMFTKCHMNITVFVDSAREFVSGFLSALVHAQAFHHLSVSLTVKDAVYPNTTEEPLQWIRMLPACTAFRLFLPMALPALDAAIYLDTDTLVTSPIEDLWKQFTRMNESEMVAMAPEHEDERVGWYNKHDNVPHVGELGVNAGVMLLNLTKMRACGWNDMVQSSYKEHKDKLRLADQDLLNAIFHKIPDTLMFLPCKWNFRLRAQHCEEIGKCASAFQDGALVLHGNSGSFDEHHPSYQILFGIYQVFKEFNAIEDLDMKSFFVRPLKELISGFNGTRCLPLDEQFATRLSKDLNQQIHVW